MASVRRNYGGGRVRLANAPAWREELAGKLIVRADRVDEALLGSRTSRKETCPFCNHEQHLPPLKVERDFMVIPGKAPGNPGHALIIPLEHKENIHELTDDEFRQMGDFMHRINHQMQRARKPVFFGFNWRPIGGQAVTHMHVHIQPTTAKGLPGLREFPNSRFFDPLSMQIIKKVQQRVESEKGELAQKTRFPRLRTGAIQLRFKDVTDFQNSAALFRELYRITDEEYSKLVADPASAVELPKYSARLKPRQEVGMSRAHARQVTVNLLQGNLPGRIKRIQAQAAAQGVALSEETLRELVRSSKVGATTKITFSRNGEIIAQFVPRATVVTPASPTDVVKGRRDTTPWGVSKVGVRGYWPVRETLDKPVLTDAQRAKWDRDADKVLALIKKALQ